MLMALAWRVSEMGFLELSADILELKPPDQVDALGAFIVKDPAFLVRSIGNLFRHVNAFIAENYEVKFERAGFLMPRNRQSHRRNWNQHFGSPLDFGSRNIWTDLSTLRRAWTAVNVAYERLSDSKGKIPGIEILDSIQRLIEKLKLEDDLDQDEVGWLRHHVENWYNNLLLSFSLKDTFNEVASQRDTKSEKPLEVISGQESQKTLYGHLGLEVTNREARIIGRDGYDAEATLSSRSFELFEKLFEAGEAGLAPEALASRAVIARESLPAYVSQLREALKVLDVTISPALGKRPYRLLAMPKKR